MSRIHQHALTTLHLSRYSTRRNVNRRTTWTLSATISSPYDSPERYADAFRAVAPDGTELGVRVLTHDHADEQPFTRSLTGLVIPDGVDEITVEGRDLANGWGGGTVTVAVPE